MFLVMRILFLSFFQNVAFSIVSRSRNRNNLVYHLIAATLSNTIWFLTFRALVTSNMDFILFIPYTIGTVAGSLYGVSMSMRIETWLGAASDSHIKAPAPTITQVGYVTKDELVAALQPVIARLTKLEGSIVQVYSRVLRKLREVRQMVILQPAFVPSAEFTERKKFYLEVAPDSTKMEKLLKATPRWRMINKAGQMRLGW